MNYESALEYATLKHKGQKRKEGIDYISHPTAVAEILEKKGCGLDYRIAALFHDLLEDTDATYEDILKLSNKNVADAVVLLTKKEGYIMKEYIKNISENEIALNVKLSDRLHNLMYAKHGSLKFCKKYIKETEDYYIELSKGTAFENEIRDALNNLKVFVASREQELRFI